MSTPLTPDAARALLGSRGWLSTVPADFRDTLLGACRLRSVAAGVHLVPVAKAGTPVGTVTSPWGGEAQLVLSRDESLLTWSDTPITASITLTIPPTGEDGQQVGIATWICGGRSARVAVYSADTLGFRCTGR